MEHRPISSLVSRILRVLLLGVFAAPLAVQLAPVTVAQARPSDTFLLYLPLVAVLHRPGISGQVTLNGAPIGGVPLNLLFDNGSALSTLATTSTASDGGYSFTGVPSLAAGQSYQVQFNNQVQMPVVGRLAVWFTRQLTTYAAGSDVVIGDFDVAAVPQLTPLPGATVALPTTFSWKARAATPSDNYQYLLFDTSGSVNYLSPFLGYADHYQLNSLPPGFSTGHDYGWVVVVNGPDGGMGSSAPYSHVTFSNSGLGASRQPAWPPGGNASWRFLAVMGLVLAVHSE